MLIHQSRQGIHQRSLPVNGNLVGGIVRLFVLPVRCCSAATNQVTRPGLFNVIGTAVPIMRMHGGLVPKSGNIRPVIHIAPQ